MPADVHVAIDPPTPKSTSSGCALTIRMRSIPSFVASRASAISCNLSSSSWFDDRGVGLAVRRLHDLTEEEAALLLAHLLVARPGTPRPRRRSRRAPRRRPPPARPRRSPGRARAPPRPASAASARAGTRRARPWPGCATACRPATRPISSASPSGASGSTSGDSPVSLRNPRISPVHQFATSLPGAPDRHRRVGVLRERGVVDEHPRVLVRDSPLVDEPGPVRGRELGHRGDRARRASRRSARPARGRAPGSSGSRSSLPCCACPPRRPRLRPSRGSPGRCAHRTPSPRSGARSRSRSRDRASAASSCS